jgi:NAD(P)-dependent dehydrogenase (short-subunit alcohol dehydrogenase family)
MDFRDRDPERYARHMAERAVQRLGDPETDIAPIAVFLASNDSYWLTGEQLLAGGGVR